MGEDNTLVTIPKTFQTYYDVKAVLDALTDLKDGELAYASDDKLLYRQSGNGGANWVAIAVDASAQIAAHTAIATAHQNAPGLITTHTALPNAHHAKTVLASGTYAGNSSANRAIPHGLGLTPKLVILHSNAGLSQYRITDVEALITWDLSTTIGKYIVTIVDSTNFYVGNAGDYSKSANATGSTYNWVALG